MNKHFCIIDPISIFVYPTIKTSRFYALFRAYFAVWFSILKISKEPYFKPFSHYQLCDLVNRTTHSTWHEPFQTMSAVVLRFDGMIAFVGAYRGICPSRRWSHENYIWGWNWDNYIMLWQMLIFYTWKNCNTILSYILLATIKILCNNCVQLFGNFWEALI